MMGMGKSKVGSVLEGLGKGPAEEEESGPEESVHDTHVAKLAELLGVDDSKAQELKDVICGIVQSELAEGEMPEAEPSSEEKPKKKGVAIVLGG